MVGQLLRSFKKSKIMSKAIKAELSYDSKRYYKTRKELYNFLISDPIISPSISCMDFELFSEKITLLKAMGLGTTVYGDYIPISAFCFLEPLAIITSYSNSPEITDTQLSSLLARYFGF